MPASPATSDWQTRVYALWDALADFSSSQVVDARQYLLSELCALLEADNAMWSGAVRLAQPNLNDALGGWRMPVMTYLHPLPGIDTTIRDYQRSYEDGPDMKSVRFHAQAGRFRVLLIADLVEPEWFESDFYRHIFRKGMNAADVMFVGAPVNEDAEAGLAFFRAQTRFTRDDCALAEQALRSLRWLWRRLLLGHGLMLADTPLTPVEQQVLQLLLQGKSTKQIAAGMAHSPNTTNEYLQRLYRKYGVGNRAELMALWLGQTKPRNN
ncbi:helix-turn-helix transcriptional regulator [Mesorhizobium sp. BAC0120]|uniref:helix-turn-helix transcriptional regulator n=1 Tax=Mesorhizobium sp. BAC0120 TaxID=3090670 RepID=UPI00298BD5EA|nr:helix-turn-helix transcriptional regulator [Mesorhizobium sp. BAC0120]MDW6022702.1 helix-turn-helix transcriptional regulator [Mesorhizobium sp. BAC0120]